MNTKSWKTLSNNELELACGGQSTGAMGRDDGSDNTGDIQQNTGAERPFPVAVA